MEGTQGGGVYFCLLRRSIVNRGKRLIIMLQKNHQKFLIIFAISRREHHIYICAVTVRPMQTIQTIQAIVYRYRRRIGRVMFFSFFFLSSGGWGKIKL